MGNLVGLEDKPHGRSGLSTQSPLATIRATFETSYDQRTIWVKILFLGPEMLANLTTVSRLGHDSILSSIDQCR